MPYIPQTRGRTLPAILHDKAMLLQESSSADNKTLSSPKYSYARKPSFCLSDCLSPRGGRHHPRTHPFCRVYHAYLYRACAHARTHDTLIKFGASAWFTRGKRAIFENVLSDVARAKTFAGIFADYGAHARAGIYRGVRLAIFGVSRGLISAREAGENRGHADETVIIEKSRLIGWEMTSKMFALEKKKVTFFWNRICL